MLKIFLGEIQLQWQIFRAKIWCPPQIALTSYAYRQIYIKAFIVNLKKANEVCQSLGSGNLTLAKQRQQLFKVVLNTAQNKQA